MFGTTQRDLMVDLLGPAGTPHRADLQRNRSGHSTGLPPEAATARPGCRRWTSLRSPIAIRLVAEVPGVRPSDVKISVEDKPADDQGHEGGRCRRRKAEKVHRL